MYPLNRLSATASIVYAKAPSVQEKIKNLLLSMNYHDVNSVFLQFWTPTKSKSGRSILSVLEQPFGMGSMSKGFCRYRYVCMKQGIQVEENIAGPVGRVFTRGSPEYSERMGSYSKEEFPMRDYAKFCGSYLALPIFEHGKCIGVLEYLSKSCGSPLYSVIVKRLKGLGLCCIRSHSLVCHRVDRSHRTLLISTLYKGVLRLVRKEHNLPLIQIWIPCFCDKTSSVTRLFCLWASWRSYRGSEIYIKDERNLANGWYSVENGKGLIGRAYLHKKSCFLGDTTQLSISEYPLAHFTRSRGFTACFAIPVQSLDPRLHDIILEVFLPRQQNSDHGNVGILLQSLLSTMAQNHHRWCVPRCYTGPIPFKLEENKEFSVQYSHLDSENFLYFDVSQNGQAVSPGIAVGSGREERHFQPSEKKDNDLNSGIHVAPLNRVDNFRDPFANGDAVNVEVGRSALNPILYKRKEFHNIQSPASLQRTQFVEPGGQVIQEPEVDIHPNKKAKENEATDSNFISENANGKSTPPRNDEINRGYRMIVKANYRSDVAKFFFWSNSGIKVLHQELHKRFKLEVDKFKLNYKDDDGNWIILSCDEDLLFHLETSKTPGQTVLELSVLPATF